MSVLLYSSSLCSFPSILDCPICFTWFCLITFPFPVYVLPTAFASPSCSLVCWFPCAPCNLPLVFRILDSGFLPLPFGLCLQHLHLGPNPYFLLFLPHTQTIWSSGSNVWFDTLMGTCRLILAFSFGSVMVKFHAMVLPYQKEHSCIRNTSRNFQ